VGAVGGSPPGGYCPPPGGQGVSGSGPVARLRKALICTRSEPSERDVAVVGRARGQVPVANLKRVGEVARLREPERSGTPWSAARPPLRRGSWKAHEGMGREAGPTAFGSNSEEAPQTPGEHRSGRASARSGTDPHAEKHPGAAGHRGLLVLRAEERDVRNGMRALAPKGVLLCEGEKL